MMKMTTKRLAMAVGAFAFLVSLTWQAAASDLYWNLYAGPAIQAASREGAFRHYHSPVLYDRYAVSRDDPNRREIAFGETGFALVAGEPAAEPTPFDDWSRPEMFRIYLPR